MASVMAIIPSWLKIDSTNIMWWLLFLNEPTLKNQKILLFWRIISVYLELTNGSICPDWWLLFIFTLLMLVFSFLWIQVLPPMPLTKMERYAEWTVWLFSHMSNLTCFCRPRLSWWPVFLKFKGWWDPGEENILVSSVLSINKAQRLFNSSQHIPHEFTGLGLATGPPPGNYMDRLPEGLALMWLSESTQKLFILPRALGKDPSAASYWRKTQREKNCSLHTEGSSSDSDPIPPCSDEARIASILNGDHVAYFLRGPCAWNQNKHCWIHKGRKSLELCLSWIYTLEYPEGSDMQHEWIKVDTEQNRVEGSVATGDHLLWLSNPFPEA